MKMVVRAKVPGADAAAFQKIAEATKDGCPVSLVMKGNLKLEMDAALV
jgi:osmotically inducible protein OsmC